VSDIEVTTNRQCHTLLVACVSDLEVTLNPFDALAIGVSDLEVTLKM
jgi:hypothetical protein